MGARLIWPLPALLAWALAWAVFRLGLHSGAPAWAMLALASGLGLVLSRWGQTRWRRAFIALGFPVSALLVGGLAWPAWAWLLPLAVLALLYPWHAWRDAPLFPTPADVLNRLPEAAPLPAAARVLDAGCGLGHGLQALRQAYPLAALEGHEWSRLLAWACQRRCPWARVQRADLWARPWGDYQLVYLFQRPESMGRAWDKARAELAPGAYLVSLAFEVPGVAPTASWDETGAPLNPSVATPGSPHTVWVYRMPQPDVATTCATAS